MLKLKKLELLGFKSFADATRLEFQEGTIAVVGPNGCGKSNLSDAINWVLGEQSARLLRGERMTDVIFNGTGTRAPTGMAEVSLTLEDPEYDSTSAGVEGEENPEGGSAAGPAGAPASTDGLAHSNGNGSRCQSHLKEGVGHITVTRRLFRSGESEYLINGSASRLRDVQDLFLGTGLGPESYAIIEQGRIGQILSSKPSDRRLIIEEAAGVSRFKTRKRAAELKLESSRTNLARIADILEEVIKQVNSLKRQASKARRFRDLHEEMQGRQRITLISRLKLLEAQCQQLREEGKRLQRECSEAGRQLEQIDREQSSVARRCEELESELMSLRETLNANELERQRLGSRLEQSQQQMAGLESRSADAKQENAQISARKAMLEHQAGSLALQNQQLREEQAVAQQESATLILQQEELGVRIHDAELALEQEREALLNALSRAADLRNQLVQTEEVTLALDRQEARVAAERAGVEEERQGCAAEVERLTLENGRSQAELDQLAESVTQTAAELAAFQQKETSQRSRLEHLRRELSGMEARKQALEESLARHAYSTESVRRLLNKEIPTNGHRFQPLGVLADFLEVAPGYEEVVEEFLKPELDCVVVEEAAEARSGIALLRAEGTGRSTFFVTRMSAGAHVGGNGYRQIQHESGVVAHLEDLVRFEPRLRLNGDPPLPSLGKAFLVEDASAAERLAAQYPEYHFLTSSGEHYHHRLVTGGRGSNAGPLALRRDFRELERRTTEVGSGIQAEQAKLTEIENQAAKTKEALEQLTTARVNAEKNFVVGSERLRQAQQALNHMIERLRMLDEEGRRFQDERRDLFDRQTSLKAQLEAESDEKSRRDDEVARTTREISEQRLRFDQLAQELARAQAHLSTLQERTRAMESERARLDAQIQEIAERSTHLSLQAGRWDDERRQLAQDGEAIQEHCAELETARGELSKRLQGINEELQSLRVRRDDLRPQVETERARYEATREKRSEMEVALARAESDRDHRAQQCREALQSDPERLLVELTEETALSGEALEVAEEQVRELKKRIDHLGPLNMKALEELKEAEERYEFLESQRQDLLSSIEDTMQAIREIDRLSRQQFLEAFKAIDRFFAEAFRTLFGGGMGQLRLTDEEDPESGLDIAAQPPGKCLQNVLLLSGGEKALAALALLIAIFRYTPSPFCVLDEVDAPLDDTNVDRFARLILQMSRTTQFILITHNKQTMEIASTIYGVTMEEPGVSKLVSVKLEEAPSELEAIPA